MDLNYKKLPVDTDYENQPSNKIGDYLKFIIAQKPEDPFDYPDFVKEYTAFNDKVLMKKSNDYRGGEKVGFLFPLVLSGVFGIFLPVVSYPIELLYVLILEAVAFVILLYAYFKYKKWKNVPEFEFNVYDRLTGEIALPDYYHKYHFKIPFNKLKARIHKVAYAGSVSGVMRPFHLYYNLKVENKKIVMYDELCTATILPYHLDTQESWSFFVWYMDKNRPLPPSKAFDQFREQDFERRKLEGFPPPLYKSVIPTPEATPAQQLVRETFWKDQDYMVNAKEAEYDSLGLKTAVKAIKKKFK